MKWLQITPSQLKKLSYLLVFLTFDLILFGAFTRLSDSGLGCPDWPGCYSRWSPIGASEQITLAQASMPSGPVTWAKAWIEMLHRYFAAFIGLLIIVKLIGCIQLRKKLTLPVLTLIWVCLQGLFGALTVTMKLFPLIVTLHLLGGLFLLLLLTRQLETPASALVSSVQRPALSLWLIVATVCVWVQIALGGWLSTNYAVLACSEFPTCSNGQWLPASLVDWRAGFTLWRELGYSSAQTDAAPIAFSALVAIHLTHRLFAVLVLISTAGLMWQMRAYAALRGYRISLMALITLQILTGISTVALQWPLFLALMHTAGAAGLVFVLTRVWCFIRPAKIAA